MVLVNAAIWAHPWDLLDEGPESAFERLLNLGITKVNLATTMHSVQTLNPHNPERKTFFADASAYFQPDADRYGSIEPDPNETMGEKDWCHRVATAADEIGITLTSWLVPFHSSKQGRRHPEATIESPFGDSLVWGLCPSNPRVQRYGEALVADVATGRGFDGVEMELADYQYGTGYGWHHQEFFTDLGDLGEFLFGLCFCEHCLSNARAAGVDVDAARKAAKTGLEARFDGAIAADTDVGGWLTEHPELRMYAEVRRDTLAELFESFANTIAPEPFTYYLKMGGLGDDRMSVEHSWKHGLDLERLSEFVNDVTVLAYHSDPTVVRDDVRTTDSLVDAPVTAGILAGHPIVDSYDQLESQVSAAVSAGASELSFYGYGVVPERNLEWIGTALESVA